MSQNAYIKLVPASEKLAVTLEEVKEMFHYYKSITSKTGEQLSWGYSEAAFPYIIEEKEDAKNEWFYLRGTDPRKNRYILVGVGFEQKDDSDEFPENQQCYIQVSLTDISTHGDKGKANEFCKFLASKLKGELHLFNGRVMYYYPKNRLN
ncbi:DUF1885 family protein [Fictibacillus phosphorivorans]|uniref:DUF1885 family protein n=1 Tax=Fictibacillus phosphorivorans TaxID=1221500 RepID=UPI00203AE8C4|nr:DUF1885 family protein [Fictibacillus phosphorivorans]MCM3717317.1 DUF1885 family protein [Fictibacillus phosphorivorans]MCM3775005.1 DUF1885 family protein [Fictibacillus phosphorivorans]